MKHCILQQGHSRELQLFPHILEMGTRKNTSIRLDAFPVAPAASLSVYYVIDGKFEWNICQKPYLLLPGDAVFLLPGEQFGHTDGMMEIGSYAWLHLDTSIWNNGRLTPGSWSRLSEQEMLTMGKIIQLNHAGVLPKLPELGNIFNALQNELLNQEIAFAARVNQLVDEIFITITRHLTRQRNTGRDFPKAFLELEQMLRKNLDHQWTVDDMAAAVGMGTTLFNEKVKNFSGFSPLNYLINLRITEAIRLLRQPGLNVTDIALETGFYSSQHFSTTFKKLTGYTPSEFRKRNNQDT